MGEPNLAPAAVEGLKPCPFCSGEFAPIVIPWKEQWSMGFCSGCSASGPVRMTEADAIAAWNIRAPDPTIAVLQARVAELEKRTVIEIAKAAHAIGWQAGVGGMETAGAIVSYLAQHQDQIAPFFSGEASPVDWPDFTNGGCLTWHASKGGKIVHPDDIRASRVPTQEDHANG